MKVTPMSPFAKKPTAPPNMPIPPKKSQNSPVRPFGLNFSSFQNDDWLLLGIISLLIFEGSEDYTLLCALGYLFIVGL